MGQRPRRVLKVIIIFSLGIGGIVFAIRHGAANTINGSSFLPSFGVAKQFLPVIVFLLLGFELISSMAGEVKDPEKRIPKAIFTSGAVIAFLYLFATIGILLALSLWKLTLVEGLVETFKAIFGSKGLGEVVVYALGIAALYTYFTNMTTWTMGANRSAVEAAAEGELPSVARPRTPHQAHPGRRTRRHGPDLDGGAGRQRAVHQHPELALLRHIRRVLGDLPAALPPDVPRRGDPALQGPGPPPPLPDTGRRPLRDRDRRRSTSFIIAAGVVLFLWPEIPNPPKEWSYTGPLLGIVVVTLLAGEVMLWRMSRPAQAAQDRRRRPTAASSRPA